MSELAVLEQKYKELGEEIEKLRKEKEWAELPDILWRPRGERYYYLQKRGIASHTWGAGGIEHKDLYLAQQVFKTEEEAAKADRQRIAKMKVLRRVAELNHEQGWVCDWSDEIQCKNFPEYIHRDGTFTYDYFNRRQGLPTSHYAAEGVWQQVISEMGGDVKFGLWGIEGEDDESKR